MLFLESSAHVKKKQQNPHQNNHLNLYLNIFLDIFYLRRHLSKYISYPFQDLKKKKKLRTASQRSEKCGIQLFIHIPICSLVWKAQIRSICIRIHGSQMPQAPLGAHTTAEDSSSLHIQAERASRWKTGNCLFPSLEDGCRWKQQGAACIVLTGNQQEGMAGSGLPGWKWQHCYNAGEGSSIQHCFTKGWRFPQGCRARWLVIKPGWTGGHQWWALTFKFQWHPVWR